MKTWGRIFKRMLAAFRTNRPQAVMIVTWSITNCAIVYVNKWDNWWAWSIAIFGWPILAYLGNLIDPIPRDEHGP